MAKNSRRVSVIRATVYMCYSIKPPHCWECLKFTSILRSTFQRQIANNARHLLQQQRSCFYNALVAALSLGSKSHRMTDVTIVLATQVKSDRNQYLYGDRFETFGGNNLTHRGCTNSSITILMTATNPH